MMQYMITLAQQVYQSRHTADKPASTPRIEQPDHNPTVWDFSLLPVPR